MNEFERVVRPLLVRIQNLETELAELKEQTRGFITSVGEEDVLYMLLDYDVPLQDELPNLYEKLYADVGESLDSIGGRMGSHITDSNFWECLEHVLECDFHSDVAEWLEPIPRKYLDYLGQKLDTDKENADI